MKPTIKKPTGIGSLASLVIASIFLLVPSLQAQWTSPPSGTGENLRDVQFIDTNTGYATGDNSTFRKTTDGGATWSVPGLPAFAFQGKSLHFVSSSIGWIVGDGGEVWRTADGGVTWADQYNAAQTTNLRGVHFANAFVGWAVGETGHVRFTSDGGTTWVYATGSVKLNGVYAPSTSIGYMVGDGGAIFHSGDGVTFGGRASGTSNNLNGIHFSDANNGWIVGAGSTVLKTTNGGTTWTNINFAGLTGFASVNLQAVHFTDANNGMAVGEGGERWITKDGGASWIDNYDNTLLNYCGCHLSDSSNGCAVGDGGNISDYFVAPPTEPDINVTLSGTPVSDGGAVEFGVREIGSPLVLTITVNNTGSASLTGLAITKAGTNPGDFTVSALGSTTVAAGGNTTFTVSFNPAAVGARSATLAIASNVSGAKNPYNLTLNGTGSAAPVPDLTITESGVTVVDGGAYDFGSRARNSSLQKTFVITNTRNATLSSLSLNKTGDSDFTMGGLGATSLAPLATTSFTVTFNPSEGGRRSGAITVGSNVSGTKNPYNLAIEGTGALAPLLTVDRARPFPATAVRSSSKSQTIVIRNLGDGVLTGLSVSLGGANSRDFKLKRPSASALAAGATASFSVTFQPKKPGSKSALVTVRSTNGGVKVVQLKGKGK